MTVRSRRSGGLGPVTALRQVPLAVMALVVLVPLYFLVVSSFKTSADFAASPLGLPRHPTLEAYHKALAGHRIGLVG